LRAVTGTVGTRATVVRRPDVVPEPADSSGWTTTGVAVVGAGTTGGVSGAASSAGDGSLPVRGSDGNWLADVGVSDRPARVGAVDTLDGEPAAAATGVARNTEGEMITGGGARLVPGGR